MKWKKTGAALLVTTLTITSAGYAMANEQLYEIVDLSKLHQKTAESTVTATVSEKPTTPLKTNVGVKVSNITNNLQENGLPKIPADYPKDKLEGLYKAYENAKYPQAKEAIKQKIVYLIAKYENLKEYKDSDGHAYAEKLKELKKEEKEAMKELKEQEKELRKAEKHKHKDKHKEKHKNKDKD